jgi:hypothetical protein
MLKKKLLKLPTMKWMPLPNKSKKPPLSKNRPPKISQLPLKLLLKKPVKSTLFPLKFKDPYNLPKKKLKKEALENPPKPLKKPLVMPEKKLMLSANPSKS